MKKLLNKQLIHYYLFFILIISCFLSCLNQNEESNYAFNNKNSPQIQSTIDFNLINQLNESNKKVMEISSFIFNQTKNVKTLQLLIKIKKEQKKIGAELKKLCEKNLIIISKSVYNLNLIPDTSSVKNHNYPIFDVLETELSKQINIFNIINETALNPDFKQFAVKSLVKLNQTQKTLEVITP